MVILINSSKTMVVGAKPPQQARLPRHLGQAQQLDAQLKKLSAKQLARLMHLSTELSLKTHGLIGRWTAEPQALALDSYAGDIYRGLVASQFTEAERQYADQHLVILSGLYGGVRPLDGISPYRLEVGYPLKVPGQGNLYDFWEDKVAQSLPAGPIVNLASVEYARLVTPFVPANRIVSPRFLSTKKGSADFVVVHAKVARGACAAWLIRHQAQNPEQLRGFSELGYVFDAALSTPEQPTFIRPFN